MDKILQGYLEDFKKCTIKMISSLENDEINDVEAGLRNRQEIIEKMNALNIASSEFKKKCEELDIIAIDNKLSQIIKNQRNELKEKITEVRKSQNAVNAYHSNLGKSNIFSKKV